MENRDTVIEYNTTVLPENYKELIAPAGISTKKSILLLSIVLLIGAGLIAFGFIGKIRVYLILIGCIIFLFDAYFWVMTIFLFTSNRKLNRNRLPEEFFYRFYEDKIEIDTKTDITNTTSTLAYDDIQEVRVMKECFFIMTNRNVLYLAKKEGNYEVVISFLESKVPNVRK